MNVHIDGKCDRLGTFFNVVAPEILEEYEDKKILYIGAKPKNSGRLCKIMKRVSKVAEVTALEVYELNCQALLDHNGYGKYYHKVVQGNVLDVEYFFDENEFDYALWIHGPEHVTESELEKVFSSLEVITKKAIFLAMPWGISKQGAMYQNPYEVHQQPMYPEILHKHGFNTWTGGRVDGRLKSNLMAKRNLE